MCLIRRRMHLYSIPLFEPKYRANPKLSVAFVADCINCKVSMKSRRKQFLEILSRVKVYVPEGT